MISLETAKRLKEAGLVWEPKCGDVFQTPFEGIAWIVGVADREVRVVAPVGFPLNMKKQRLDKGLWLPRLDQLLAEIERRIAPESWIIKRDMTGRKTPQYICELVIWDAGYTVMKCSSTFYICYPKFYAETPEEAAALALLWVFERGRE